MQNYTSQIIWECQKCGYQSDHKDFIYRYTEIAVTPIKLKRISTQHCPKCDSSEIDTKPELKPHVSLANNS